MSIIPGPNSPSFPFRNKSPSKSVRFSNDIFCTEIGHIILVQEDTWTISSSEESISWYFSSIEERMGWIEIRWRSGESHVFKGRTFEGALSERIFNSSFQY